MYVPMPSLKVLISTQITGKSKTPWGATVNVVCGTKLARSAEKFTKQQSSMRISMKISWYMWTGWKVCWIKGLWWFKTGHKGVFSVTEKGISENPCYKRDFLPKTGLKRAKGLSVPALQWSNQCFSLTKGPAIIRLLWISRLVDRAGPTMQHARCRQKF